MCNMFHPRANYSFSVLASEALLPYFLKLIYETLVYLHQCVRMMSQKLGLGD
jgi:hypothetical protein